MNQSHVLFQSQADVYPFVVLAEYVPNFYDVEYICTRWRTLHLVKQGVEIKEGTRDLDDSGILHDILLTPRPAEIVNLINV
jgi:hypothetical protein